MERPLARCEPFHRLGYGAYLAHFDGERFRTKLSFHLRRWSWVYLLVASVAFAFHARYEIGVNVTASLPYRLFVIDKAERPERSQFVAFRWPGGGPYARGVTFVKQIVGIPGDMVTRVNRSFFVSNG